MSSNDVQKFVRQFENSEVVSTSYDDNITAGWATLTNKLSIEGEFAEIVRSLLNETETSPVFITYTTNDRIDTEEDSEMESSQASEVTFRIESGDKTKVITNTSYYGCVGEMLEWLASA